MLSRFWSSSAPTQTNSAQIVSIPGHRGRFRYILSQIMGHIWPDFGRIPPLSAPCRPNSTRIEFDPIWATLGPRFTGWFSPESGANGRICSNPNKHWRNGADVARTRLPFDGGTVRAQGHSRPGRSRGRIWSSAHRWASIGRLSGATRRVDRHHGRGGRRSWRRRHHARPRARAATGRSGRSTLVLDWGSEFGSV